MKQPRHVLLLGAGDGLALREILRWPSVERVDVVELDPVVIRLARQQAPTATAESRQSQGPQSDRAPR